LRSFQAGRKQTGRYIYPFNWYGGRIGVVRKLPKRKPFKKKEEMQIGGGFLVGWFLVPERKLE
jgi:hypothetical protein